MQLVQTPARPAGAARLWYDEASPAGTVAGNRTSLLPMAVVVSNLHYRPLPGTIAWLAF